MSKPSDIPLFGPRDEPPATNSERAVLFMKLSRDSMSSGDAASFARAAGMFAIASALEAIEMTLRARGGA